ncbi:kinetochore complex Sim4 subunit Fta1-domain-containing protein [Thelonectria olida]|uniref:Kinetochore complex Sim4 subunit Fta1-domain-containing protein n=1 Tax=Thelonectria olida TaxID=1576542 RepID=A0A9P9ALS0_9HYPO|nr:kinetochore complex Sim4 subunit Fta1-domain-containing protein [Thelonectria olida]
MARLSGVGPEESFELADSDNNDDQDSEDSPPFFNTTFSTHRVSPLHVGPEGLTEDRLEIIAHRLRDTLVGDVVRGVQVGLQATETPMGQVGPLKAVRVRWFQATTLLGDIDEESSTSDQNRRGLWIDVRHENASYAGLLLPGLVTSGTQSNESQGSFLHLPLLLLRMPLPLKNVIMDWLATAFDCRVSRLTLGTQTILGVWESWIETAGFRNNGPDFTLSLAFNAPLPPGGDASKDDPKEEAVHEAAPGLKSIDVTIPPLDLRRFARVGTHLPPLQSNTSNPWDNDLSQRRRLAGGNSDDGWAWLANKDTTAHPFTAALGRYLDYHLALNLFHPSTRVIQISCGGFVLGQTRLKILKVGEMSEGLSRAAWAFVQHLGDRIKGDQLPRHFSTKFNE